MNFKNLIEILTGTKHALCLFLVLVMNYLSSEAQSCFITSSGPPCVGEPILFSCNTVGASNFNWDFNGEGGNTSLCSPSFVFNVAGVKTITLSLRLSNGQTCNASYTIEVKDKPVINVRRVVNKTQCFANNSFCFLDSSKATKPGVVLKKTIIVFDDGVKYTFTGDGPRTFCHSFQDPAGGTYGMTIEVEDSNGCMRKTRMNAVAVVQPSLGLTFSSPQPQSCDSVQLCVTNNSSVPLDSIASFTWDWGDGNITSGNKTTPALWKTKVCHWFRTQGPSLGSFTTRLKVTTNFGCTESFTFNSSATNLIIKPVIIADFDSLCVTDATFSFKLKDGPIPKGANPLFEYELPKIPANYTKNWTGSHKFGGVGPFKINFSFTHQIPGCGRTVYDTILVIGPVTIMEGPITKGMRFIEDTLRYQCVIKDTVKFHNFSQFYHNDKNMMDDDSLILIYDSAIINKFTKIVLPQGTIFKADSHEIIYPGFNKPMVHTFSKNPGSPSSPFIGSNQQRGNSCVLRMWDFDDDYCEKCTTDTRLGINVGKNCKYSKDSLPQHWYTPWDSMYQTKYGLFPEYALGFNKDSGLCFQRKMWSNDSVAIIRDTILYYGDNPLAKTTKDSSAFTNITKKEMVKKQVTGPSKIDMTLATKFYLQAGDTVYIDANNGVPANRWVGPRYITVQPGSTLIIKNKTDKALYNVWIHYIQDTVPLHLVKGWHKVWKSEKLSGYANGDSINAAAHRQKFYNGTVVRCLVPKLSHKDVCHPLACEHTQSIAIALMPPSAKKLKKLGTQCLGGDQDNYGITFVLDDTKPGCTRTWAEINFDTALNKTGWVPAIGPNLTTGAIPAGGLPPVNPVYASTPGFQINGPAPGRFSRQFTVDDIKDTVTGYINVGLIVGNGIWREPYKASNGEDEGLNYPQSCQDTVYYPKFARFPILDNRFRIIKPQEGENFTKICRKDTVSLTTLSWNRTYVPDVEEALWSLTGANVGKFYNKYYVLTANERYSRFVQVHKDTPYLIDKLQVIKRSFFDGKTTTLDSQEIRIAKILKWHAEADITPVYEVIKLKLEALNIDISEVSPAMMSDLIWNGVGTFGQPFTGSRGCLDTTGFGRFIRFYKVADEKQSLHFRDTTLMPVDKVKGADGVMYNAYSFVPQYSGYYIANFALRSRAPENCTKSLGTAKKVIVGFYAAMNYTDTILCHGQQVVTSPDFKYFEVYPDINLRLLDPTDYWRDRISEAGNPNREGYTRTDLSKADDDISAPLTIFGGFPWALTGMDNKPGKQLVLGGGTGSIYYNQDTGDIYHLRTAASDSSGCKDTISQDIYITSVRAKFSIDQSRPQCNTIIEFFDSSFVMDPCVNTLGSACDKIIKWTIEWGDNSINAVNKFFNELPANIGHDYTRNGLFKIVLTVETELGCIDTDTLEIYIPGPVPFFDTMIPRQYCVNDKVNFSNLSKYIMRDSSIWIWNFGDEMYGNQYDTVTAATDTMNHRYAKPGRYNVFLNQSFQFKVGTTFKRCNVIYPDTSFGQQPVFYVDIIAYDETRLKASPLKVCLGDTMTFTGNIVPEDRYVKYDWNFGDTSLNYLLTDTISKKVYSKPGKYMVTFMGDVNSVSSTKKICPAKDSLEVSVANVKADFDIDTTRKPLFCFNNASVNSIKHRWSFYNPQDLMTITPISARLFIADGNSADYDRPQICEDYRDSVGSYWVCLEAENDIGCKDTICKKLVNNFKTKVLPPNVFSPNVDQFTGLDPDGKPGNNEFNILIEGEDKYELVIFDRWGVKVFESKDKTIDWNGKINNNGAECPDGTYYYILHYRYKGLNKDEPVLNGTVRIMR